MYTGASSTPLHHAAIEGHVSTIVALLDAGADASKRDHRGRGSDALSLACKMNHADAARALLDNAKNIDVDSISPLSDFSALMSACYGGFVSAALVLLDRGASVNRATQNGATALTIASQNGHADASYRRCSYCETINANWI